MLADLDSLWSGESMGCPGYMLVKSDKRIEGEVPRSASIAHSRCLCDGKPAWFTERKPEEEKAFHMLGLLTSAAGVYVCNVEEASAAKRYAYSRGTEELK